MKNRARPYRQTARAAASEETAQAVLKAAGDLLEKRWYDEVTLQDIADHAGVAARTVQRKFGSKDNLARAYFLVAADAHMALRDSVAAGDIDAAMSTIALLYERDGDNIIRYLALEARIPAVAEVVAGGRALHRSWVERVFAKMLPARAGARRAAIALLIVATDVYTWKLLRRDAGLSGAATSKAMRALVIAATTLRKEDL